MHSSAIIMAVLVSCIS